jgi:glycosyltransferase involved in cell wall biosynthesis
MDRRHLTTSDTTLEVSFVMPCLNEAETIERCIQAAFKCIREHDLQAEVIVADNGSSDGSQDLARKQGARVIDVPTRGVGAAIMAAVRAARGRYIILGDSDLQHDFAACFPFVEKLREGCWDLVMGSRLKGRIMPGAMRSLNRYIGNPSLSFIGRLLFRAPVSDFHCGLRAFTRESFLDLNLRTIGFEFTTEHILKSAVRKLRITEIPITVYPEGRSRPPHLRRFSDGWRTLRFMLLLSPRWTLVVPGLTLMLIGTILSALVLRHTFWLVPGRIGLDVHSLILGCMMVLAGYTALSIGAAARIYAIQQEIGPPAGVAKHLLTTFTLERGLLVGSIMLMIGLGLIAWLGQRALTVGLKPADVQQTLRPMIVGATLVALGSQTILMSFFYSMLSIRSAPSPQPPPT